MLLLLLFIFILIKSKIKRFGNLYHENRFSSPGVKSPFHGSFLHIIRVDGASARIVVNLHGLWLRKDYAQPDHVDP
ncbi:hypothetical protein QUF72_13260 [Desulfobacterales bacterium HSG2]|nr:hypothetical protein [Desulfobacterales bacterium HSG2]